MIWTALLLASDVESLLDGIPYFLGARVALFFPVLAHRLSRDFGHGLGSYISLGLDVQVPLEAREQDFVEARDNLFSELPEAVNITRTGGCNSR